LYVLSTFQLSLFGRFFNYYYVIVTDLSLMLFQRQEHESGISFIDFLTTTSR